MSNVATRTNALWQSLMRKGYLKIAASRNPHECAVAKTMNAVANALTIVATRANALWQRTYIDIAHIFNVVATRANALWQSGLSCSSCLQAAVATRANALWQRGTARCTRGKNPCRNPRECAEAKLR